jgi:hypothetical protein
MRPLPRPSRRARSCRARSRPAYAGRWAACRSGDVRLARGARELGPARSARAEIGSGGQAHGRALRRSEINVYLLANRELGDRLAGQEGRRLTGVLPDPARGFPRQLCMPAGHGGVIDHNVVI